MEASYFILANCEPMYNFALYTDFEIYHHIKSYYLDFLRYLDS